MKKFLDKIFRRNAALLHVAFIALVGIMLGIADTYQVPALTGTAVTLVFIYLGLAFLYVAPAIPKVISGLWRRMFPKKQTPPPVNETGEDKKMIVTNSDYAPTDINKSIVSGSADSSATNGVETAKPEATTKGELSASGSGNTKGGATAKQEQRVVREGEGNRTVKKSSRRSTKRRTR